MNVWVLRVTSLTETWRLQITTMLMDLQGYRILIENMFQWEDIRWKCSLSGVRRHNQSDFRKIEFLPLMVDSKIRNFSSRLKTWKKIYSPSYLYGTWDLKNFRISIYTYVYKSGESYKNVDSQVSFNSKLEEILTFEPYVLYESRNLKKFTCFMSFLWGTP